MKKVFEPVTKSLENTSGNITKTNTETSIKNNQTLENLNNKLLELMKDRSKLASYLTSLLSKITKQEISSQYKLVKDSNSNRVNVLKTNKSIPVTLYNNMLTFRDKGREFELKGNLLEMILIKANKNYNVDFSKLSGKKYCMILQKKCILI